MKIRYYIEHVIKILILPKTLTLTFCEDVWPFLVDAVQEYVPPSVFFCTLSITKDPLPCTIWRRFKGSRFPSVSIIYSFIYLVKYFFYFLYVTKI